MEVEEHGRTGKERRMKSDGQRFVKGYPVGGLEREKDGGMQKQG